MIYSKYILPRLLDLMCSLDGFSKKRQQIFPKAKGKILEVGIGSGLNLEHYNHSIVESVVGIDPAEPSIKIAKQKINMLSLPFPVEFIIGSAESMSFNDSTFDSIVVGYSLCTIPDVERALSEISRVLKDDGRLYFVEHGLSPEESIQKWQHRIAPYWKKIAGGCNLNRNTEDLIRNAGFSFEELKKKYIKGPKIASFHYYGVAKKANSF